MKRAQEFQNCLRGSSPLSVAQELKRIELYDKKDSQKVFDEVYKQFENGGNQMDNVVKPVILTVIDGLMEKSKAFRQLRAKGLTASRVLNDCEAFSYDNTNSVGYGPNAYEEAKNIREKSGFDGDVTTLHRVADDNFNPVTGKDARQARLNENQDMLGDAKGNSQTPEYNNNRKAFEDKKTMNNYKDNYFGDKNTKRDEYRNDDISKNKSQTDHIIPLARVYDQFSRNPALNSEDIKRMANQTDNFAMTEGPFNNSKGEQLNEEMHTFHQRDISEHKADKEKMKSMSEQAQKAINQKANECVANTLLGRGNVKALSGEERECINAEVEKEIHKKYGGNITREQKKALIKKKEQEKIREKQHAKAVEVYGKVTSTAVSQAGDFAIGNLIMVVLRPIYYEIKDIVTKGLEKGIKVKGKANAIKKRFSRVKDYILKNGIGEALGLAKDFVKMFITAIIEGLINLFVGFYKMVFKLIKEGIKIFVKAYKVIWGEEGRNKTEREKGDALLKIIGASVGGMLGIFLEGLLANLVFIPGWARMVLATMCSGLVSILFMNALDKMDLFSVKSEKRRLALEKIYDARIKEVEEATKMMDAVAIDVLKEQQKSFDNITKAAGKALDNNDFAETSVQIKKMASFLSIELPYRSTQEFVKAYDSNPELCLD